MEATRIAYEAPTLKLLTLNAGTIVCTSQRVVFSKYEEEDLDLD